MQKHTKRQVNDNFKDAFISDVCHRCLLFLIKLRWPKNKSIYDNVKLCREVWKPTFCSVKCCLLASDTTALSNGV